MHPAQPTAAEAVVGGRGLPSDDLLDDGDEFAHVEGSDEGEREPGATCDVRNGSTIHLVRWEAALVRHAPEAQIADVLGAIYGLLADVLGRIPRRIQQRPRAHALNLYKEASDRKHVDDGPQVHHRVELRAFGESNYQIHGK